MSDIIEERASAVFIDILVVIDTEYIKKNYSYQNNPDKKKPVGIDHKSQYMIATGARSIAPNTQGTADLSFGARTDDQVRFRGTSLYANSDDAVIVYGITAFPGQKLTVFNDFVTNVTTIEKAVMPATGPPDRDGLPPNLVELSFSNFSSSVRKTGKENFSVNIAVYTRSDEDGSQKLFGYFWWDPTITVNF